MDRRESIVQSGQQQPRAVVDVQSISDMAMPCLFACFLALRFVGEVTRVDATLLRSHVLLLMLRVSLIRQCLACLPASLPSGLWAR
jgi:hypothetical protein